MVEATPGEHAAKRQRLDGGADGGGLADGEVTRVAAQGPAACYVCRLADVPGKFRPDKVGCGLTSRLINSACERLTAATQSSRKLNRLKSQDLLGMYSVHSEAPA